jgi:hypothetical protein
MQHGRTTAAQARTQRFGMGNQISYEAQGRVDRAALTADMAARDKTRKRQAARSSPAKGGKGMNAGTLGGAYLSSLTNRTPYR